MSAYYYQRPIFRVRCDRDGCDAEFQAHHDLDRFFESTTRHEAGEAGWDVPPPRGKGSRRGTDFCPDHALTAAEATA